MGALCDLKRHFYNLQFSILQQLSNMNRKVYIIGFISLFA